MISKNMKSIHKIEDAEKYKDEDKVHLDLDIIIFLVCVNKHIS